MHPPQHIYGIDFSGAQDAGKKIWVAEGVVKTDSLLNEADELTAILVTCAKNAKNKRDEK
jgi:hypothetical protein